MEGLIGFARRNFLVPIPRVRDWNELNELLLARCLQYGAHRLEGREDRRTVEERFQVERTDLLALPPQPWVNETTLQVKVDGYRTVRVDRNRYSVPPGWVGRWLWAHLGCWEITLYGDNRVLARHPRLFSSSQWQIDPLHYLDLLHKRPGAFDRARPIVQWKRQWPASYEQLLGQLRQRRGESSGTREFLQILKLHEEYESQEVEQAVEKVCRLQCGSLPTVRQLLGQRKGERLCFEPLSAELIPGITDRRVGTTDVAGYGQLLGGER